MKPRPVHEFRSVFSVEHARRSRATSRGAVAIELVLVAPAVVFLLLLGVAGGRLSGAQALVDDAAVSGARAASLAPGPAEALGAAQAMVTTALQQSGADCVNFNPQTDVSLTTNPPGFQAGGTVTVTVTCDFANSGLSLPINNQVVESSTAPIDPYRSVGT
jgi:Flp pilus assembly protein TadG